MIYRTSARCCILLLVAGLFLVRSATAATEPAAARPNFVVILTDDQRADAMGCAGNPNILTPQIDALAARGVRFERCFVTTSICSPSRAALLTGRYGSGNGVMSLTAPTIRATERTWPQLLKAHGYRTAVIGKWHLENKPAAMGFDVSTCFAANGAYYGRTVQERGVARKIPEHLEVYTTAQAVAFLREASAAGQPPFALWLCTQLPHMDHRHRWDAKPQSLRRYDAAKLPVPASWEDDLSGKPPYLQSARHHQRAIEQYGYDRREKVQEHLRDYYATITDMDTAIGRVLAALDDLKLRPNTYVVFASDNGWLLGEHRMTSKVLPYEESIRVPLIIAGPGIEPGVRPEALVLNIDIAPTLLELAGIDRPGNLHGASLLPLLKPAAAPKHPAAVGAGAATGADAGTAAVGVDGTAAWRKSIYYEAIEPELGSWPLVAIRTERWKYVQTFKPGAAGQARKEDLAFEELYDLKADPHEVRNLAHDADHAAILQDLRAQLARLRAETAAR